LVIDWTIKNDQGTAGIQMNLDFTQVEYVSSKAGKAYRITPTLSDYKNGKDLKQGEVTYAWAQDNAVTANDNAVVCSFTVNVPDEKGTYTVKLDKRNGLTNKAIPKDQTQQHDFVFYGLDIVVGEPTTTSSGTTPTQPTETTTTQTVTNPPESAGSVSWTIGERTAAKGGAVKIPVIVSKDDGTAGFVAKFEFDDSLKFDCIEWANGYSGDAILNQDQKVVVWASASGSDENADDTILYLNFVAPENEGSYPVRFSSLEVTNTMGETLDAKTTDGAVKVDPNLVAAGEASWTIGKGTAKSGDTAIVPVIVKDPNGTAGITARFDYDPRLTFLGFEWGDQYSDAAELNPDKCSVVWANGNGSDETADGEVLYLKFTAPEEEGEYPVSFALLDVTNTDDQQLLVTRTSGAVVTDNTEIDPPKPNLSIVTNYELKYTPPTRKNYWSHDTRTFKENGGFDGMTAELTVYKYYVNDKNEFTDAKGNTMNDGAGNPILYDPNGEFPLGKAQAFETRSKDVSALVEATAGNTPKEVWDQSRNAGSKDHKFTLDLMYHAERETDADYKISDEAIRLGTHDIFIGVKGDYNLDDRVSVDDAQNALKFYTEYYVAGNTDTKLNENPELDGTDGLVFYLVNVVFRKGDASSAMADPQRIGADDAQSILIYYTENNVAGNDTTWEDVVGYDLLDSFYQGKA
ncbi:MAG: hypothetical protein IKI77_03015, partial [Oscillospiraceae bacterium]|nr:hypothetical protein [Oscillospiraceae bacterium]